MEPKSATTLPGTRNNNRCATANTVFLFCRSSLSHIFAAFSPLVYEMENTEGTLESYNGLALFPQTLGHLHPPSTTDPLAIHFFLKSLPVSDPDKLVQQARSILEAASDPEKKGIHNLLKAADIDESPAVDTEKELIISSPLKSIIIEHEITSSKDNIADMTTGGIDQNFVQSDTFADARTTGPNEMEDLVKNMQLYAAGTSQPGPDDIDESLIHLDNDADFQTKGSTGLGDMSLKNENCGVNEFTYRSLYMDSQKKVEVLTEENFELSKKLENAYGKNEGFEKFKDMFSSLSKGTEAAANLSFEAIRGALNVGQEEEKTSLKRKRTKEGISKN